MKTPALFFTLILSIAAVGCGRRGDKAAESDAIVKAYRLIDAQRSEEAIRLLEDRLQVEPGNYDLKVTLASAYAHRAGIKMQTLFPALREMKKLKGFEKKRSSKNISEENHGMNTNRAILKLARLIAQYAGVAEAFTAIPMVNESQMPFLERSIALLDEMKEIRSEDAVYRAVLRIVLFKKVMLSRLFEPNAMGGCQIDFAGANDTIVSLGKMLVQIHEDMAIVNPKSRKDLERKSNQILTAVGEVNSVLSGGALLDEAARTFLADFAAESGIGTAGQCGTR